MLIARLILGFLMVGLALMNVWLASRGWQWIGNHDFAVLILASSAPVFLAATAVLAFSFISLKCRGNEFSVSKENLFLRFSFFGSVCPQKISICAFFWVAVGIMSAASSFLLLLGLLVAVSVFLPAIRFIALSSLIFGLALIILLYLADSYRWAKIAFLILAVKAVIILMVIVPLVSRANVQHVSIFQVIPGYLYVVLQGLGMSLVMITVLAAGSALSLALILLVRKLIGFARYFAISRTLLAGWRRLKFKACPSISIVHCRR